MERPFTVIFLLTVCFLIDATQQSEYCDDSDVFGNDFKSTFVNRDINITMDYYGQQNYLRLNVTWDFVDAENEKDFSTDCLERISLYITSNNETLKDCNHCEPIHVYEQEPTRFFTNEHHQLTNEYLNYYGCDFHLVMKFTKSHSSSRPRRFLLDPDHHEIFMKHSPKAESKFIGSSSANVTDRSNFPPDSMLEDYKYNSTKSYNESKTMYTSIIIIICLSIFCVFLLSMVAFRRFGRVFMARLLQRRYNFASIPTTVSVIYEINKFEIPRSLITIKKELASGNFGTVFEGTFIYNNKTTRVAIKQCKELTNPAQKTEFLDEIEILKKIGYHKNIVQFLGQCTLDEPYLLIMEYIQHGNLKEYLVKMKTKWDERSLSDSVFLYTTTDPDHNKNGVVPKSNGTKYSSSSTQYTILSDESSPFLPESQLDSKELQRFATEIALGMSHLEKLSITHRDLAARNILITADKSLKISDFGMSRTGIYHTNLGKLLPLRWCSIEWLQNKPIDCKSDVWSYGVVLWEIGNLGAHPYNNIANELLLSALLSGYRLQKPEICSDKLYAMMLECWQVNPADRPNFNQILEVLDAFKFKLYDDFNRLRRDYVFPTHLEDNT